MIYLKKIFYATVSKVSINSGPRYEVSKKIWPKLEREHLFN